MASTPDIGTNATAVIDGKQVRVQICGWDELFGYHVSNRQWGGKVNTWVPVTDLAVEN